jgi:hypothetical protein
LESQWYPLALATGAVVAAPLALHLIRAAGGFVLWPPETQFVGGRRLVAARLAPVLTVVLAGLAYSVGQQPVPSQNQRLIAWLSAHHLHSGLGGFWQANEVTHATSNHIQIRPLAYPGVVRGRPNPGQPGSAVRLMPGNWQGKSAWYNPQRKSANFVVPAGPVPGLPAVLATFGPPARQCPIRWSVRVHHGHSRTS